MAFAQAVMAHRQEVAIPGGELGVVFQIRLQGGSRVAPAAETIVGRPQRVTVSARVRLECRGRSCQNKRLLIQRMGVTDSSAEFTVKKYTSKKVSSGDDEWRHGSIRLEPLNPEFEAFELGPDDFRVIAEFIQVLE